MLHVVAGSFGGAREEGPFLFEDERGRALLGRGAPESAEFCDGPGPGMALEQNSFPAATPPGLGRRWFEGLTELLNIIIAKLYNEPLGGLLIQF